MVCMTANERAATLTVVSLVPTWSMWVWDRGAALKHDAPVILSGPQTHCVTPATRTGL